MRQQFDQRPQPPETRLVIRLVKIDRAADRRVHRGPAELFRIDRLSDRRLDQRRAGQAELAAVGHQQLVAQHGQVRAAGDAVAHHGGVLRNAGGRQHGVVAKDAAEVVFVGKDLILQRQEHAGRIDEINHRQTKLHTRSAVPAAAS